MISEGHAPPAWTGWITCKHCGPVPFSAGESGGGVDWCPWCHNVGDVIEAAKKGLEALVPELRKHFERKDAGTIKPSKLTPEEEFIGDIDGLGVVDDGLW